MITLKNSIWVLVILLAFSCAKDEELDIQESRQEIATELQAYFDTFSYEAASRNITIDFSTVDISAYVDNIKESGVVGQCTQITNGSDVSSEVTIDANFWSKASRLQREMVVFHELGHCILKRDHDESSTRGVCNSIMHSGTGSCRLGYSTTSRTTYLDELFSN